MSLCFAKVLFFLLHIGQVATAAERRWSQSGFLTFAQGTMVDGGANTYVAADGTIRKDFAESIEANSVHGSDSLENAAAEIAFFFAGTEIVG